VTLLLDTDWVIDYLRRDVLALRLVAELAPKGLSVSVITYGEAYEGIIFGRTPRANEEGLRLFLEFADVLPVTTLVVRRFARIRGVLRRAGKRLEDTDLLIAATALEHDLTLVTRNVNHFARVPGLRLYLAP
jgi:tRNA(fMet)-specific endonuclease VapC